jgi:predicted kinase
MSGSKLIVLRGNSGSGKTTIANRLRELSKRKIAIIEQDYIRRTLLREKENATGIHIDLIFLIAELSLARGYDVILEGILNFEKYGVVLKRLADLCPEHYFYYFDISFHETLRRHATKPNAHEFGEQEMRGWYRDRDVTRFEREIIIPEESSFKNTVEMIRKMTGI